MSTKPLKESEIKFLINLDENNVPESINWEAEENGEVNRKSSKAIMTSIWDSEDKTTMRIDLWTKDMQLDEMKIFFHQSLLSMADTFERATGEKAVVEGALLVLTGHPMLVSPSHKMVGERMVFRVGERTVECDACTITVADRP